MSLSSTPIVKFGLSNELDIVLAHKRATQLCQLTGIRNADRTRFVTAISEICRNCIEYAKDGTVEFFILENKGNYIVQVAIKDRGRGIEDVERYLTQRVNYSNTRGIGLFSSKKLVDHFKIDTSVSGTEVLLGMKIPDKHPPINNIIIKGWTQHFSREVPVSPYEEIKKQNEELLEITEQLRLKNLEAESQIEEIKILNDKLSKSNNELEAFTYTISHDLKSPINNLKMLVSFAEKSEKLEKKNEYMAAIGTSVNKLEGIIDGLVEIINLQNAQQDSIKVVAFEELIEKIRTDLELDIQEGNTIIETNFDSAPEVRFLEAYIYSILSNLISNAVKYRDMSKPSKISVKTKSDAPFILLEVADNGIGMNLDKLSSSLFKPFTRFTKQATGRGIGLHLVKTMVEKNEGRIEVESEPGKGSLFRLYLREYN